MSNKTCGECKHHKEKCHCEKFGCYAGESDFCDEFEPAKKQIITNGDKSWQRCDQELAEIRRKLSCELCANANTVCCAPAKDGEDE